MKNKDPDERKIVYEIKCLKYYQLNARTLRYILDKHFNSPRYEVKELEEKLVVVHDNTPKESNNVIHYEYKDYALPKEDDKKS